MKYSDFLNIWLNEYIKISVKIKTFNHYSLLLKKYVLCKIGDLEIKDLNSKILQNLINELALKRLSTNTILAIVSVVKQSLKYGFEFNIIEPFILKLKFPKYKQKEIEIFNLEEQKMLINYCNNSKDNYFGIIISLFTGIRIGELLALTWSKIDFKNKILIIDETLSYTKIDNKYQIIYTEPKTFYSIRKIPLCNQIINRLKIIKQKSKCEYIISTNHNSPVSIRNYQKCFERILDKLKIKHRGFHSLRHTFATNAIEIGMDIKSLSEILGHSSATITLNRYVHSKFDYKKQMITKLEKIYYK